MREYKLTRSNRKTVSIKINEDTSLEVKSPHYLSKKEIDEFVISKEKWIAKHTKEISKKYHLKKQFNLNFGDYVLVRGQDTSIVPIENNTGSYDGENKIFYIPKIANSDQIKEMLIKLYKLIAKSYIPQRVSYFAEQMGVNPTGIRITSAKTRWGSCSGKNSVNFTWKLIMTDDETIDYVIVHELAHIKQYNHSPKFWQIVKDIFPNYQQNKEKLKVLGKKLSEENWN